MDHLLRLVAQYLFSQVIQDIAVAAGKRPDEFGGIRTTAHGEGRHLQPGNPALGAVLQR